MTAFAIEQTLLRYETRTFLIIGISYAALIKRHALHASRAKKKVGQSHLPRVIDKFVALNLKEIGGLHHSFFFGAIMNARPFLFCVAITLVSGCAIDSPTSPTLGASSTRVSSLIDRPHRRPTVTSSQRIARQVPGFGGAFVEGGVLNVYLTPGESRSLASSALLNELRTGRRAVMALRFRVASFGYEQLEALIERLLPVLGPPGIASYGIDEWNNRIRIGVVTDEAKAKVLRGMITLGVPNSAVVFENEGYFVPTGTHDLTDQVRPLVGGLQIHAGGFSGETGTLTAIVKYNGTLYGLMSSHVADNTGTGGTGNSVYQNANGGQIGTVSVNPAFVANLTYCPTNARCRFSDAALIALNQNVMDTSSLGSIAKPGTPNTSGGVGTINFDDSNLLILTDEGVFCGSGNGCNVSTFPGDSVTKIGYATGWTGGTLATTSVALVGSDGLYRLDNLVVRGKARPGDSGAPVVSDRIRLAGIQWGIGTYMGDSTFDYSNWPNVGSDLTGSTFTLHSIPPYILGYEQHYFTDSNCLNNPDTFKYYLVKGYPNGTGGMVEKTTSYMGHAGYSCQVYWGFFPIEADYTQSSGWQACSAKWGGDCPCAEDNVGGTCSVHDP